MAINMNKDSVAHTWANQSQDRATTPNGSFSFEGLSLYSYSTEIARIIERKDGSKITLFINQSYSVTTTAHQSAARMANWHVCFEVPNLYANTASQHAENLKYFKDEIIDQFSRSSRARKWAAFHYDQAMAMIKTYNNYLSVFNIKRKEIAPSDYNIDDIKQIAADNRSKEIKAEKRRIAKIKRDNKQNHDQWLAGKVDNYKGSYDAPILLRVNGNKIETTRRADIPLKYAPILWALICKAIRTGIAWTASQDRTVHMGHYELNDIDKHGNIKIGCHIIRYDELNRIAAQLNYKGAQL